MQERIKQLAALVGRPLQKKRWQMAVAESCTGGLLGAALTSIPGSSSYFYGGVVSYSNQAKQDLLGVSLETLTAWGAVSEATAREMAEGIRKRCRVDLGIAITGIAGPDGGSPHKPVGTVYLALATEQVLRIEKKHFGGNRTEIREASVEAALQMLKAFLEDSGDLDIS
ncbi:MAG: CinA family protein [Syntrophomonadaceae bacterium]|nr:CinA family protein [Syntrophomonadaceae bacterium]